MPLSGTESREDPHPLDETHLSKRSTEDKLSDRVAGDELSVGLQSPTSSGSTHPNCYQKREEARHFFETLPHNRHILGHIGAYSSLYISQVLRG